MRYLQRLYNMYVDTCATTMRQQTLERGEAQLSGKYLIMNLNQVLDWLFFPKLKNMRTLLEGTVTMVITGVGSSCSCECKNLGSLDFLWPCHAISLHYYSLTPLRCSFHWDSISKCYMVHATVLQQFNMK